MKARIKFDKEEIQFMGRFLDYVSQLHYIGDRVLEQLILMAMLERYIKKFFYADACKLTLYLYECLALQIALTALPIPCELQYHDMIRNSIISKLEKYNHAATVNYNS